MGIFKEYIARKWQGNERDVERRKLLAQIGKLRNTATISYAARIAQLPVQVDISVNYEDMLPFSDALADLSGERVSVILETPGGSGEIGRDIVELLHDRFSYVEFIVPGTAKSTGTIMCLGGHEILMGPASSLGPIDAQLFQDGKRFSADALIEGFKRIKEEVTQTGQLNAAYIPILQRISPGELQNAQNALDFARVTVTDWLVKYKFVNWEKSGVPVAEDVKRERAREIAENLSKQSKWFTHGRSLRISDLEDLGLKIVNFSKDPALSDAIQRYHVLLRMTFDAGNVYKIVETPQSTIARRFAVPALNPQVANQLLGQMQQADSIQAETACSNCGAKSPLIQIDFAPGQPLQPGSVRYPSSGVISCAKCGTTIDLRPMRADLERQTKRPALNPQPTA
jgi:hypothetical protein